MASNAGNPHLPPRRFQQGPLTTALNLGPLAFLAGSVNGDVEPRDFGGQARIGLAVRLAASTTPSGGGSGKRFRTADQADRSRTRQAAGPVRGDGRNG